MTDQPKPTPGRPDRVKFEEIVFRDYFMSTITRNANPPQPKLAGALDFVSTCTLNRDQFCERYGDSYKRQDVSAMWHGWQAASDQLQQRVDELQIECDGWRQEGVALRQMVRDYEPDKERMDAYRRDLEEIGKTIGCDHIDDGLQRCVESTLDDLESDNQRLRELLRECHEQMHKLVSVFVSDQDGAHRQTCDLMRTVRDQLGMSHIQDKP